MVQSIIQNSLNLVKLIKCQTGSVVSKEIFKNNNGTVTLFAFDKNQGLSPHKTPHDALVYVLDGEVVIMIGGKENYLKKGDVIHMPANIIHSLKSDKRFKMLLVMLKSA